LLRVSAAIFDMKTPAGILLGGNKLNSALLTGFGARTQPSGDLESGAGLKATSICK